MGVSPESCPNLFYFKLSPVRNWGRRGSGGLQRWENLDLGDRPDVHRLFIGDTKVFVGVWGFGGWFVGGLDVLAGYARSCDFLVVPECT